MARPDVQAIRFDRLFRAGHFAMCSLECWLIEIAKEWKEKVLIRTRCVLTLQGFRKADILRGFYLSAAQSIDTAL